MKFKTREIVEKCFYQIPDEERVYRCMDYLQSSNIKTLNSDQKEKLLAKVKLLRKYFNRQYASVKSHYNAFKIKCEDFMESDFDFEFQINTVEKSKKLGRRKKAFNEKSVQSKQKEIERLAKLANYNYESLLRAALLSSKRDQNSAKSFAINSILKQRSMKEKIKKIDCTAALNFYANLDLSKRQYVEIRKFLESHNIKILPCYDLITRQKLECYPDEIEVNDFEAKIPLKNVIRHMLSRTIKFHRDGILKDMNAKDVRELMCNAEFNIGADGSSGHSRYQMQLSEDSTDTNLFSSTCTLLMIKSNLTGLIFLNPAPSSIRFCTPYWLLFEKESSEIIDEHRLVVMNEIAQLQEIEIDIDTSHKIKIKSNFKMGAYDGKIVSRFCNTANCNCPNCRSTPTEMAILENVHNGKFQIIPYTKSYVFPSVHGRLQIFHFFYNVAAKKILKNDRSGNTDEVKRNKEIIRKKFFERLNLIVDTPNPKGGNFTDGNVARKAFENVDELAYCFDFDEEEKEILHRIAIMLTAGYSKQFLDFEKFRAYGIQTYILFLEVFPWYKPATYFHRFCIHFVDIAMSLNLPVIFYSEEASEARNKLYRQDRLFHARKTSRQENILDVLHNALITSDYFISLTHHKPKIIHKSIPAEAQELLADKTIVTIEMEESGEQVET